MDGLNPEASNPSIPDAGQKVECSLLKLCAAGLRPKGSESRVQDKFRVKVGQGFRV